MWITTTNNSPSLKWAHLNNLSHLFETWCYLYIPQALLCPYKAEDATARRRERRGDGGDLFRAAVPGYKPKHCELSIQALSASRYKKFRVSFFFFSLPCLRCWSHAAWLEISFISFNRAGRTICIYLKSGINKVLILKTYFIWRQWQMGGKKNLTSRRGWWESRGRAPQLVADLLIDDDLYYLFLFFICSNSLIWRITSTLWCLTILFMTQCCHQFMSGHIMAADQYDLVQNKAQSHQYLIKSSLSTWNGRNVWTDSPII